MFLFSIFGLFAHAKNVKVYCEPAPNSSDSNTFTLAASLEISENNEVSSEALVSFAQKNSDSPPKIIPTTGRFRDLNNGSGYTYLFPVQNASSILHFILKINVNGESFSELETLSNVKYLSRCVSVE